MRHLRFPAVAAVIATLAVSTGALAARTHVKVGDVTDNRSTGQFSDCKVELAFFGDSLHNAYGVRQIVVDEAVDSTGKDLVPSDAEEADLWDFDPLDSDRPRVAKKITLNNPSRKATSIAQLSGRLEILVPSKDPSSVVTVGALGSKTGKPLTHPRLEEAGIKLLVVRPEEAKKLAELAKGDDGAQQGSEAGKLGAAMAEGFRGLFEGMFGRVGDSPNALTYAIEDPNNRIAHLVAIGGDGSPLETSGKSWSRGKYTVDYDTRPDASTSLEIYLATEKALVQVPFSEADIYLP